MSERPRWMHGDVIAGVVVVAAIVVAAVSHDWRGPGPQWLGREGPTADTSAIDPARMPVPQVAAGAHHRSPFNDSLTTRAEARCVQQIQSQLAFQLHEPVVVKVTDRYGVGDQESGAGDSLDIDGLAQTPSGRISAWHCAMANLGNYAGSPMVSHVEGR